MTDKEDKTVRQFVLFCRTALMYEKIFDTYHADYFSVMGYEIGIVDGDLAQALRELSDKYLQIVLLYYIVGLNDREISEIYGTGRTTICYLSRMLIRHLRLRGVEGRGGKYREHLCL